MTLPATEAAPKPPPPAAAITGGSVALQCVASMAGTLVGESLGGTLPGKLAAGVLGALIGAFLLAPGRQRRRRIVAVAIVLALLDMLRRAGGALAAERPRAWLPANWTVVGLAAVVGFAGGSAVTTARDAWGEETFVSVPQVRGEPRAAALGILDDAGLTAAVAAEPSEPIPEGAATRTDPPSGASVEEGAEITLYVSSGPTTEAVTIPDVRGQPRAEALSALRDAGLRPRTATEESADVTEGSATRTDPAAGAEVEPGAAVTLFVSSGPAAGPVEVPDVVGSTREEAYATLEDAGLQPEGATEPSQAVAAGTVVRSDPGPGSLVDEGSAVIVVVSSGPPPLVVPDVAGLRTAAAVGRLEAVGLAAGRSIVGSTTVPNDTVIATDPPAGMRVERGDTVTLRISCGDEICVE